MNVDDLAGILSHRIGLQQSRGNSIMHAMIGFLAQKMKGQGMDSMLYGRSAAGIKSI
jgi:hypothetical protein